MSACVNLYTCLEAWQGSSGLGLESANQKINQADLRNYLHSVSSTQAPWLHGAFIPSHLFFFPLIRTNQSFLKEQMSELENFKQNRGGQGSTDNIKDWKYTDHPFLGGQQPAEEAGMKASHVWPSSPLSRAPTTWCTGKWDLTGTAQVSNLDGNAIQRSLNHVYLNPQNRAGFGIQSPRSPAGQVPPSLTPSGLHPGQTDA